MTNDEAKFLLEAYRPNGADSQDERMQAAVAQAQRDPMLRDWFEGACAFDAAIAAKLRSVTPPAGLREAVVAGVDLSKPPGKRGMGALVAWLGVAAAVAVGTIFLTRAADSGSPQAPQIAALRAERIAMQAMADTRDGHVGLHASEDPTLARLLEGDATRLAQITALSQEVMRNGGCRSMVVDGHEIFEVCFVRDGAYHHLYVTRRANIDVGEHGQRPMFREQEGIASATWADKDTVFVLVSHVGIESLRKLV